jgi:hypothetical protein
LALQVWKLDHKSNYKRKQQMKNWQSHIATIAGLLTALGTAWSTIDFSIFEWPKDAPKLILPGMIALGGYLTKLNLPNKNENRD